jgi:hypothetical protein
MAQPSDRQSAPTDAQPQTFERRAFIRYPCRFEMLWQLLGMVPQDLISAQVFDLSTTGVGLVLDQAIPSGKTLIIRLPTSTMGWNSHLVRIKHCTPMDDGRFQVGCSFVKPLSAAQLQAHL